MNMIKKLGLLSFVALAFCFSANAMRELGVKPKMTSKELESEIKEAERIVEKYKEYKKEDEAKLKTLQNPKNEEEKNEKARLEHLKHSIWNIRIQGRENTVSDLKKKLLTQK